MWQKLDVEGIVHKEFVPPGQINGKFCYGILLQLKENIQCKCPGRWHNNSWALCLDNAPAHASLIVWQFSAYMSTTVIPHPSCSLDLAPCDFFLFLNMKLKLKGQCFGSIKEIQTVLQNVLKMLTLKDFQKCF
jgi:hypothetical protein